MSLFGSSKIVKIAKQPGLLAWDVDLTDSGKKPELKIENGLQCVSFIDGIQGESFYSSSNKQVLNTKEGEIRLIAVDFDNPHSVRCGVGGVTFSDYDTNLEGSVGMNATISVKIEIPVKFVKPFMQLKKVSDEDLEDYLRTQFKQAMSMALKAAIDRFGTDADSQIPALNVALMGYLQPKIKDELGLEIKNFSINNIHFSEEYQAARKEYFEKKEKERQRNKEKQEKEDAQERELDMLGRIAEMRKDKPSAQGADGAFCMVCGHKNKAGAVFCEKCGNKIK